MASTDDNGSLRRQGIQVISRAAQIMAALERVGDDVTFSELGAAVGFPRSTVHRIAAALEAEGPVITSSRGLLRLGPRLVSMARASRRHLGDAARPRLAEFSRTVEETVGLSAALLSR